LLELKELAENRESAWLERSQRLRELRVSMLYNPKYVEERERILNDLHVLRVSYSHNC